MRVAWMVMTIVLMPVAAMAGTDIVATCYQTCADSTHSNPEYKACVVRAADRADQLLNDRSCRMRSVPTPRTWAKAPRFSSAISRTRRSNRSPIAMRAARSRTASPSAAPRLAAIIRHVSALSPMSASMTSSASRRR
jgi:hypothetical protein